MDKRLEGAMRRLVAHYEAVLVRGLRARHNARVGRLSVFGVCVCLQQGGISFVGADFSVDDGGDLPWLSAVTRIDCARGAPAARAVARGLVASTG